MIRLEPLTGRHDRSGFDCGVDPLNVWLRQTALQHQGKGISRTFVAVPRDEPALDAYRRAGCGDIGGSTILGFYALASAFVLIDDLPPALAKRFPRQIPVTRLGRLATRTGLQGQGLGQLLLTDAVSRARNAAEAVGSAGIFVDAKNDNAARFYQRYGFVPCGEQRLKRFLSMW